MPPATQCYDWSDSKRAYKTKQHNSQKTGFCTPLQKTRCVLSKSKEAYYSLSPPRHFLRERRVSEPSPHPHTSPVESSALEVDGGQEQQHACVIRLLPPQLHAVALSRLKVPWLILSVRQLSQPLEGKHTFCWFWSTNTAQGGRGGNNMLEVMEEIKAEKWKLKINKEMNLMLQMTSNG